FLFLCFPEFREEPFLWAVGRGQAWHPQAFAGAKLARDNASPANTQQKARRGFPAAGFCVTSSPQGANGITRL
ncbi:hypothetical protein, partial [Pseudomonas chlororaphis]|uniref:hypothetical protein n=1 Tax=Pseudomonas chlororaphis TaxID=587753 RepID=UPI001EE68361